MVPQQNKGKGKESLVYKCLGGGRALPTCTPKYFKKNAKNAKATLLESARVPPSPLRLPASQIKGVSGEKRGVGTWWVPFISFQFERKSNENEGEQGGSGDRIFQKIQKIKKFKKIQKIQK